MQRGSDQASLTRVKQFLAWIAKSSKQSPSDDAHRHIRLLHEKLASSRFPPLEGETLGNILRKPEHDQAFDLSSLRQYIYLRPEPRNPEVLPILTFKYDFSSSDRLPELRLRLAFFKIASTSANPQHVRATGFRFESDEGEGPGSHNYFHAQPITAFDRHGPTLPCEHWLPDSYPAFPLEAKSYVGLIMALMCSIYNQAIVRQMATDPIWLTVKTDVEDYDFVRKS